MYANDSCHFMAAKSWFTERPLLPVSCTEDKHLVAIFKQVAKTRNDVTAILYHLSPFSNPPPMYCIITHGTRQTDSESLPTSIHPGLSQTIRREISIAVLM